VDKNGKSSSGKDKRYFNISKVASEKSTSKYQFKYLKLAPTAVMNTDMKESLFHSKDTWSAFQGFVKEH